MTTHASGPAGNGEGTGDGALPVTHSLFDPIALARMLESRYAIGRIARCVLERSYANDVFRVDAAGRERYYLKVHRSDWRTPSDVDWDLGIQRHLLSSGVAVARPVAANDGSALTVLEAPEGRRAAVLYADAPGRKPERPFTADLYERFGRATAKLHAALDTLPDPSGRAPDDIEALVLRPGRLLRERSGGRVDASATIGRIVEHLAEGLRSCAPTLDWGICHGDLTLDNFTITSTGEITFFDFDLAAPSWRARDPCGAYAYSRQSAEAREFWPAFLSGYRQVRRFSDADERAVPLMYAVNQLWDLGHEIACWSAWSGEWRVTPEVIRARLVEIERWIDAELN